MLITAFVGTRLPIHALSTGDEGHEGDEGSVLPVRDVVFRFLATILPTPDVLSCVSLVQYEFSHGNLSVSGSTQRPSLNPATLEATNAPQAMKAMK